LIIFLDASDGGLEAAKSYIEARAADEQDSLLERATGAIMSIASAFPLLSSTTIRSSKLVALTPPPLPPFLSFVSPPSATGAIDAHLDLKVDPEYSASVERHAAVLNHLSHAVAAGDAVAASARAAAGCLSDTGKALTQLGEHESRNAGVLTTTRASVAAAASGAMKQNAAIGAPWTPAPLAFGPSGATSPATDEARDAFESHQRALTSASDGTIAGMFANADMNDPHSAFSSIASNVGAPVPSAPPLRSAETLHAVLLLAGRVLMDEGARAKDQLKAGEATLCLPLRAERDKEAGLGEAVGRRNVVIQNVREANNSLVRNRRARDC
jgi:hypothetical protein